jgi:hypothetical protein
MSGNSSPNQRSLFENLRRPALGRISLLLAVVVVLGGVQAFAGKKKPKPAEPAAPVGPPLPSDLNLASLRVKALDQLYELDLSPDQLKQLKETAAGAESHQTRSAAKGTDKLTSGLQDFQSALLERKDVNKIDKFRNALPDLLDDDDVQIDDGIKITATARSRAPDVDTQFKATQIAAYLAAHADEIGDPVEMMVGTAEQVQQLRSAGSEPGEIGNLVHDASTEIGQLVAGLDDDKAKSVAADAEKWIRAKGASNDEITPEKHQSLEESARQVVHNVHPMRVLNNWINRQMAMVLSNPQLPDAIDAILQTKQEAEKQEGQ